MSNTGKQPFAFKRTPVFGNGFRLGVQPISKVNMMIMLMVSEGIIDLHGRIVKVDYVKENEHIYRAWLWRYIQYLWLENADDETFPVLTHDDGTYDSDSFEKGVLRVLGRIESTMLTMDDLILFINEKIIKVGVRIPVLDKLHEQLLTHPQLVIRTFAVARGTDTDNVSYLPMSQDEDDPATITVKIT